jgi:hypothetical protein
MKRRNRTLVMREILAAASVYLSPIQTARSADEPRVMAPAVASAPATRTLNLNPVSFYKVPLVCPAAPQIGCGSASKPLLLELEHSDIVSEAWLNRAGTMMAVVWSEQSKPRERAKTLKAILKQRKMTAKEVTGDAKQQAVKDFQSENDWYRGADVDRLSEEEAGVIANRWIGRFREKIVLTDEKAKTLREAFTTQLKRQLTGQTTREETREEMLKIARQHLDEKDVAVLVEAFGSGFRPKKGE